MATATIPEPKTTIAEPERVRASGQNARRSKAYGVLAGIVALASVGYGAVSYVTRDRESTDDAQVDADAVTVSARVQGLIAKRLVQDNQSVKKGDLLVEIDPTELKAKLAEAEAQVAAARAQAAAADSQVRIVEATSKGSLSTARAQLSGSMTSVESADAQIQASQASLSRAEVEAARASTDLTRADSLRKDQAIPQAEMDIALTNDQAARAAVAVARAQLSAAQKSKDAARTQIAEAQGRVEQSAPVDAQLAAARANAELARARADAAVAAADRARLELSYTRIESPTDGVLSRLEVREGQLVQSGQPVVVVVPNATYVMANFKETQVGRMRPGQRAEIEVDAYPRRSFEGRVEATSPATGARFSLLPADNASGNFVKVVQRVPVKIEWVNLPPDVAPAAGMSVDVTVRLK